MTIIMNDAIYDYHHVCVNRVAGDFSMKVSKEQMALNRVRILDAASRLFRDKGFEAVSVAEVMKAAGLTHGGFYGHFSSKDDLIAQSLAHVLAGGGDGGGDGGRLAAFMDGYLSPGHRDNAAVGCPTAGLAASLRHQAEPARTAMTEGLRAQIERFTAGLGDLPADERRRAAIGSWAAMVGAVILARAIDDPALSDEVLRQTRAWIDAGLARARDAATSEAGTHKD